MVGEFGPATVDAFIATQSVLGRFPDWKAGSWAALLEYLRSIGVPLADPPSPVLTPADALLAAYTEYEARERGLAAVSVQRSVVAVRDFMRGRMREDLPGLETLTAAEVTAFVVEQSRRAPRSLGHLVPALRSLLRYLHVTGVTPAGLASAVPVVTGWKLAGLPKALPEDQVRALLASCDLETEVGQRDRAILTLMWRLGLRIGEVATLRLEDLDWRCGELLVTGKGRRQERLPLPADVGETIVSYLTGWRPQTEARNVFVCANAPARSDVSQHGQQRGGSGRPPARSGRGACTSATAHRGHGHARRWRLPGGDRAGSATSGPADHRALRQGRHRRAAPARPPLAGIGGRGMTALRQALADYLRVRRALGAKLDRAEKLLTQFLAYLEQHHADVVTVEHAVAWATLPGGAGWWHTLRLTAVRQFAAYLRNLDERTQIPPAGLLAHGRHRATPYLYSAGEIDALVAASRRLPTPVAAAIYPAMISLLAVTGMRFGEAIALDVTDFDDQTDTVMVRAGKFGKSRLLPVHSTTAEALRQYLAQRQDLLRASKLADRGVLFISAVGTRLDHSRAQKNWRTIRDMARLAPRSANCRPRIHDLRHSFAVATLLDWYRRGADVPALLPTLSTYLGHVDPTSTY